MTNFGKLISGFRIYKATIHEEKKSVIRHVLRQGLRPTTLFIACCDLRISPDNLFSSNPGDLYTIRNIGGFVPPYSNSGANGVMAAIEYAVSDIYVENIVVLGHAKCEAIKCLMSNNHNTDRESKNIGAWLSIADKAREAVLKHMAKKDRDEQEKACEQEAIILSLQNLINYPFIKKRLDEDNLGVFGWHFNIEEGMLKGFNPETGYFEALG